VLELRNVPKMIETDARQNTDFVFGEDFLAELNSHHCERLAITGC
jgi:hypothetical protein